MPWRVRRETWSLPLDDILRRVPQTLSAGEERLVVDAGLIADGAENIYDVLSIEGGSMKATGLVWLVLACVCLAGCTDDETSSTLPAAPEPVRDVIVDADMDFDDTAAIAYLCREHKAGRIRIHALTVANSGAGYPGKAIRHLRCLRERCGLLDVPIADGPVDAPNAFPAEIRDFADSILDEVFADCGQGEQHSELEAPELIAQVLGGAERGTIDILTFGPLTNVARALERETTQGSQVAELVGSVHSMGGAVRVEGNLCCGVSGLFDDSQEFNIFVDPGAAAQVLRSLPPGGMTFVPLDATNYVRVEEELIDRLVSRARTPEGETVADIARQLTPGGTLYWWDPLSAVAAVHPDIVTYELLDVMVIEEGPSAGRTEIDPSGTPAYMATRASGKDFERIFVDALDREEPK